MIGSVVAGTLADIGENYLNEHERQLIFVYAEKINMYIQKMDKHMQEEIDALLLKFSKWNSMAELTFDFKSNFLQLEYSVRLAKEYGVPDYEILHSLDEIDTYFCE